MAYTTEEERQDVELGEDEVLIFRAPFRWRRQEFGVISSCFESYSPEYICELKDWKLVRKVGDHMAVVEV